LRFYSTDHHPEKDVKHEEKDSKHDEAKNAEPGVVEKHGVFLTDYDKNIKIGQQAFELKDESNQFFSEQLLEGDFGTMEKPVLVPSWDDGRIVGCEGGPPPRDHQILWHEVRAGKPLVCLECGQVFKMIEHPLKRFIKEEQNKLVGLQKDSHTH